MISPDYLRYQGIDDNLLERSTLYSINLQLKLTQAQPRSTGSALFYKTLTPSSSLARLIFESSAANEILHSDKRSSPFKLLQPPSVQPRRCFLSRQLPAPGCFLVTILLYPPALPTAVGLCRTGRASTCWVLQASVARAVGLFALSLPVRTQEQVSELSRTFFN